MVECAYIQCFELPACKYILLSIVECAYIQYFEYLHACKYILLSIVLHCTTFTIHSVLFGKGKYSVQWSFMCIL